MLPVIRWTRKIIRWKFGIKSGSFPETISLMTRYHLHGRVNYEVERWPAGWCRGLARRQPDCHHQHLLCAALRCSTFDRPLAKLFLISVRDTCPSLAVWSNPVHLLLVMHQSDLNLCSAKAGFDCRWQSRMCNCHHKAAECNREHVCRSRWQSWLAFQSWPDIRCRLDCKDSFGYEVKSETEFPLILIQYSRRNISSARTMEFLARHISAVRENKKINTLFKNSLLIAGLPVQLHTSVNQYSTWEKRRLCEW